MIRPMQTLLVKWYERLRKKSLWWTLFVVWLAAVFYGSSMTGGEVGPYVPTFLLHKLGHFIEYSSGAVILALGLRFSTNWDWRRIVMVSVVAVSVYGATDEWHQSFTPGRGPEVRDWLIDTVSGVIGAGALLAVRDWLKSGPERGLNSGKP
jgi:VanZ family protein